jgi:hypothetical protein
LPLEIECLCLGELGRTFVKLNMFSDAVKIWERKLEKEPTANTLERAWLMHDTARCYINLNNLIRAMSLAEDVLKIMTYNV